MTKKVMIEILIMSNLIMYSQLMIRTRGVGRADSLRGGRGGAGFLEI